MKYPSLKPVYALQATRTSTLVLNRRTQAHLALSAQDALMLRHCDGTHEQEEISLLLLQRFGARASIDWHRFTPLLNFTQTPAEAPCGSMHAYDRQVALHEQPWPFSKERSPALYSATFSLTHLCSQRCLYCPQGDLHREEDRIDGSHWLDALAQLYEMGLQSLTLTGGEAILHPVFWPMLSRAAQLGIYVTLHTNGTWVGPAQADQLQALGVQDICFHLPSLDDMTYDSITRAPGNLRKAMRGLALLKERGILLRVETVLTPWNVDEDDLRAICRFCHHNGVEQLHLIPFLRTRPGGQEKLLTQAELARVGRLVDALDRVYGSSMQITYPGGHAYRWVGGAQFSHCGSPCDRLSILPGGEITACAPAAMQGLLRYGNIKTDTIQALWHSDIPDAAFMPGPYDDGCIACPQANDCRSGCLLLAHLNSGNPWGMDPRCARSTSSYLSSPREGSA